MSSISWQRFLELSGADYPRMWKGQAITPLEGESFVDVLRDDAETRSALYF